MSNKELHIVGRYDKEASTDLYIRKWMDAVTAVTQNATFVQEVQTYFSFLHSVSVIFELGHRLGVSFAVLFARMDEAAVVAK